MPGKALASPRRSRLVINRARSQRCKCRTCVSQPDDPQSPNDGRKIPVSEALQHAKAEKRRKTAEDIQARLSRHHTTASGLSPPPSPPTKRSPEGELRETPTPDSSRRCIGSRPSTPEFAVCALIDELKESREGLEHPETFLKHHTLTFERDPRTDLDPSALSHVEILDLCRLNPQDPVNSAVIGYQQILSRARQVVNRANEAARSNLNRQRHTLKAQIEVTTKKLDQCSEALRLLMLREWDRQRRATQVKNYYNTSRFFGGAFTMLPRAVLGLYLTIVALYFLSDVSQEDCSFVLGSIRDLFVILLSTSTSIFASMLPKAIYTDVRTVVKIMDIAPDFVSYLVCPKCHTLYPLEHDDSKVGSTRTCTKSNFGSICGASLYKKQRDGKGGEKRIPINAYHHQPLRHYLGRIFANPTTAPWLHDNPLERPRRSDGMWDVWDSPCFSRLKGPDGKAFVSLNSGKGESRLVFSVNFDGFNPGGNKEAGKKTTSSAVYLICMNLPPSLRYKMEHVYLVGVIPGPQAPSDHEINYLLEPLIDELLQAWEDGIYLSQTAQQPQGWRVRCAVGPLVCDLPAARQMSGFAHYRSSNFCSECHQKLADINDLDFSKWRKRSQTSHRKAASLWKDAESLADREKIMEKYGVRWSELLRLPYWDPTHFTVIDPMHAFYLRLFQHHIRSVWGMDVKIADGMGVTFDMKSVLPTEVEMQRAADILRNEPLEKLSALPVAILRHLTREISTLPWRRKKVVLVEQLRQWRVRQGWWTEDGQPVAASPSDHVAPQPKEFESDILPTKGAVEKYWTTASKTKIGKTNKRELCILFKQKVLPALKSIEEDHVDSMTVRELREQIHAQRFKNGLVDEKGSLLSGAPEKTRVLGQLRLKEVRRDMQRLRQPTWVSRAPSHPGEKKWGKFTADQWKTFCVQNLPVTLIRLWGDKPEGSFERSCLDNFMHLVSAVKLANLHVIDEERIQQYEKHIREYLTGLLKLFPGTSITPYQHLALHFGDHLRRFGPVHAWRCFPFERFNYILQSFPTNNRPEHLEQTMFSKFCCSQRIRSLYQTEVLPDQLHPLVDRFVKNFASDQRGSRLSDIFTEEELFGVREERRAWTAGDLFSLAEDDYLLLKKWYKHHGILENCPRRVVVREELYRFGQRYTDFSNHIDDSQVTFKGPDGGGWEAGSIVKIFSAVEIGGPTLRTWALIQPYSPLSPHDAVHDRYRDYRVAGGRLFQHEQGIPPPAVLVEVTDIIGHLLSCVVEVENIQDQCLLVLPLNKVSRHYVQPFGHRVRATNLFVHDKGIADINADLHLGLVVATPGSLTVKGDL